MPIALPMEEASQPGEARRLAVAMAQRLGFDEAGRGCVALVVTEAGTNLVKHAKGGELILRPAGDALEILALDRGPGMADVARFLVDGVSTAGSPGNGLGSIARLSGPLDIYSLPEVGTAMLIRLALPTPPAAGPATPGCGSGTGTGTGGLEVGVISLPYPGESECGDAWAVQEQDGRTLVLMADGLGHGPQAAEAAREAIRVFRERADRGPAEVIRAAQEPMRGTRGAALAIAAVDPIRREVRYAGVGNISGSIHAPGAARSANLVSHNGTVGHEMRKVQEFTYPWPPGALLVMHSDGLSSHWRLDRYPGLAARNPGLVAGVLLRDARRGRDDATVLAARDGTATSG